MNKQEFLSIFNGEDSRLIDILYNKYSVALKVEKSVYTNSFYPVNIYRILKKNENKLQLKVSFFSVFEEGERGIIGFNCSEEYSLPCDILKIESQSKFNKVEHKDFLGSIMALGLNREKFGDLIVEGSTAYVALCSDISLFVYENLSYIGKVPCKMSYVTGKDDIPKPKFSEVRRIVSSMRIDCVVGALTGMSRSESERYVKSGLVLLNYMDIKEKDKYVNAFDVITVRKYGKFKIGEEFSRTSKGKVKFVAMKYT